ncbi:hypothetical protein [Sphingobacterium paludis]|uniref:Uncharacterized protein n=1 Tax=Sphingobacterium paludis TaxID=1476465 RepID=A0A4R7D172_9SPHI|nr:hypothetical protein [Sphingobacterium paludis]TDS14709.1 hypothetical protein B0I21_103204 [Sphingobacterium paludis]
MHQHFTEYTFGDIVYLKTDSNQEQWIITDITLKPNLALYHIACGSLQHDAYDFEMSRQPDANKKMGLQ